MVTSELLKKVEKYSQLRRVNSLQMKRLYSLVERVNSNLEEVELNRFADSSRANNGGGYHQPAFYYEDEEFSYRYEDTSCGDFGCRERWELTNKKNGKVLSYTYNTMDGSVEEDLTSNNHIIYG